MKKFAKKLIFNIAQNDLDHMTTACIKEGVDQSEFIRRAIRVRVAEQRLAEISAGRIGV
jgi:hypothetical protein